MGATPSLEPTKLRRRCYAELEYYFNLAHFIFNGFLKCVLQSFGNGFGAVVKIMQVGFYSARVL